MVANRNPKSAKRVVQAVTLICWNAAEGREHAASLQRTGFKVKLEVESRGGPAILRRLRNDPPDALVIDLGRLPMQEDVPNVVGGRATA